MPLNTRQKEILSTMGISLWNARSDVPELGSFTEQVSSITDVELAEAECLPEITENIVENLPPSQEVPSVVDWLQLQAQVKSCQACELHSSRLNTVFGVGDEKANWMIIGEAPGADEDRQGEPFVGKAGQLLNQMFISLGLSRERVFIANILKCRPPNNRDPKLEEVVACQSFLDQQIDYVQPKVILAVGRISAQNLLQTTETIGRIRGKKYLYRDTGIPIVATYHPAYLLRSPLEKRKVWQDLVMAKRIISGDCD